MHMRIFIRDTLWDVYVSSTFLEHLRSDGAHYRVRFCLKRS